MASGFYNCWLTNIMGAVYNMANGQDTIKCALLDNSHTFTAENDAWSDVSANEITGTGYTGGGATLANQALTIDDGDDEGVFDSDNPQWTTATFSAYHAVLYDVTASNALIISIDFGGQQQVTAGTFTITVDAEGWINIAGA